MADKGWQRKFEEDSDLPEWQAAIEARMLVARSGPTMMAWRV